MNTIPLIDLKEQYKTIKEEVEYKILEVMQNTQYIMGPNVKAFEMEFAKYTETNFAISVGNGTDALVIALKALDIGPGDEVITTPFTFFATAESISSVGATPVFVDVEKDTFNINPKLIEEKITNKTKAIMIVHIFGQCANMRLIWEIAQKHKLKVVEDACQAVGGMYEGKRVGSLGDVACFSFFPTKNLGCAGDGGMIVTNNEKIARLCKAIRTHGSGEDGLVAHNVLNGIDEHIVEDRNMDNTVYNPAKYYNYLIGQNSRLDEIQAAILRIKLQYIEQWNERRNQYADIYNRELRNTNLILPYSPEGIKHAYHMYIVQSEERGKFVKYLDSQGIATGVYYPVPLHLQKAYKNLGYKQGDMPNAEYLSARTFAIPIYPELTQEQLRYIIQKIKRFGE